MSVTYKNAPLVELIAELRWSTGTNAGVNGQPTVFMSMPRSKDEELYMHLGALLSLDGYGRFERIVPPGFLLMYGQAACRFKPTDPTLESPLYQIGTGVFTANALPPYESWAKFSPYVQKGIERMFEAHRRAGIALPSLNSALVRYVDAFRDNLTNGVPIRDFLREVMKLDLVLPDAILSRVSDPDQINPTIQLSMPTAAGQLSMKIAEGKVGNERAIVTDTNVLVQRDIGDNVNSAMQALTDARQLIHDIFRDLTAPLHQAMEPTT